jgi:hypothetical protein
MVLNFSSSTSISLSIDMAVGRDTWKKGSILTIILFRSSVIMMFWSYSRLKPDDVGTLETSRIT